MVIRAYHKVAKAVHIQVLSPSVVPRIVEILIAAIACSIADVRLGAVAPSGSDASPDVVVIFPGKMIFAEPET